jgi:uncharacterized protein (DUF1501 family)
MSLTNRFSRRAILKGGSLIAAALGTGLIPAFAERALADEAAAGASAKKKTFCFLFLRGALDGLHVVHPYGEPRLAQLRPDLALPAPGSTKKSAVLEPLLDLGVPGFGLHSAMSPLMPMWKDGSLALVHAVGSSDGTRSHFDAQNMLELGTPGRTDTPHGWLARALDGDRLHANHLDTNDWRPNDSLAATRTLPAVSLSAQLPRSLQGAPGALAFASVDQLRLRPLAGARVGEQGRQRSRAAFEAMYAQSSDDALAAEGRETFQALQLLEHKVGRDGIPPADGVHYPGGPLGNAMKQLAQLIKADVGLRVGCADAGGWDTHLGQPGALDRNLRDLAQAMAAFHQDLGARAEDVVLIAATEFGRTVRQNGAAGTDHGHGSVAFVLGGGVNGGKLHGRWPGLADDQLYEGRDLAVTTDLRAILLAGAKSQLGPLDPARVFPGFNAAPFAGLMRA